MKPKSAHLSKLFWFAILSVVAVALFAAACAAPTPAPAGGQAPAAPKAPAAAAPAPTPAPLPTAASVPSTAASRVAAVKVTSHPQLGPILTDGAGRTLYLFTRDELNKSNCSGGCAQNWAPLTTTGAPVAGGGVTASFLGTITRADGTTQVTYNGWPLYYWFQDAQPGDALGQDVGKVWFVVSSYGGPIQSNAAVKVSEHPQLGTVLVEASGRTLYLFTKDELKKSNCSGNCAMQWQPLLTVDTPTIGDGVAASYIGTIKRQDGTLQVTYNGWPLYYWYKDAKPGDATGQNVGKVWFVVSTFGGPIQTDASIKTAQNAQLGTFLVEASGRTLYLFTRDAPNKTNCTGNCAMQWQPLLTVGKPSVAEGLTASLLGTITRPEGGTQVTYNGSPLYYWYLDAKPGDTLGQNVGRVWFVLSSDGKAILVAATAPPAASTPTPAPVVSAPTPTAVAGSRVNVDISNFTLPSVTISVGTTVVWTNRDGTAHTSTADSGKWQSGLLSTGDSFSYTFAEVGTFSYHCEPHPGMRGTITVTQQGTAS